MTIATATAATFDCEHGTHIGRCATCASDAKFYGGEKLREWRNARAALSFAERFPRRYRDAYADHPQVLAWADAYVADPAGVESLLLVGPVGTGKTHQAYGAIRRAASCGRGVTWQAVDFADFCAELRPSGKDPEGSLARYRDADLLLVDDLGAAKSSEWVEETTYRLINARYKDMRTTVFTTNLAPDKLAVGLGDRIASRLVETCQLVPLLGADRRRAA
jgi:DNA replication protein DnaC